MVLEQSDSGADRRPPFELLPPYCDTHLAEPAGWNSVCSGTADTAAFRPGGTHDSNGNVFSDSLTPVCKYRAGHSGIRPALARSRTSESLPPADSPAPPASTAAARAARAAPVTRQWARGGLQTWTGAQCGVSAVQNSAPGLQEPHRVVERRQRLGGARLHRALAPLVQRGCVKGPRQPQENAIKGAEPAQLVVLRVVADGLDAHGAEQPVGHVLPQVLHALLVRRAMGVGADQHRSLGLALHRFTRPVDHRHHLQRAAPLPRDARQRLRRREHEPGEYQAVPCALREHVEHPVARRGPEAVAGVAYSEVHVVRAVRRGRHEAVGVEHRLLRIQRQVGGVGALGRRGVEGGLVVAEGQVSLAVVHASLEFLRRDFRRRALFVLQLVRNLREERRDDCDGGRRPSKPAGHRRPSLAVQVGVVALKGRGAS
ncbi:serine/arginine repetitive matrix protein 2, putative [Babesia caballi]|uniref:Serine/arginine repetitive matrix protein 2, putative n=1 Tax=Babesia caballi TaxID=5871 RepID=A0AAV4LSX8_BABCB|nr:serine/arginine repetitive matrix protein 2, putative [Babesia caballi]